MKLSSNCIQKRSLSCVGQQPNHVNLYITRVLVLSCMLLGPRSTTPRLVEPYVSPHGILLDTHPRLMRPKKKFSVNVELSHGSCMGQPSKPILTVEKSVSLTLRQPPTSINTLHLHTRIHHLGAVQFQWIGVQTTTRSRHVVHLGPVISAAPAIKASDISEVSPDEMKAVSSSRWISQPVDLVASPSGQFYGESYRKEEEGYSILQLQFTYHMILTRIRRILIMDQPGLSRRTSLDRSLRGTRVPRRSFEGWVDVRNEGRAVVFMYFDDCS